MTKRTRLLLGFSLGALLTVASAWVGPLVNPPMVSFPGLGLALVEKFKSIDSSGEPSQSDGSAAQPAFVPWVGAPQSAWLGEPAWLGTVPTFNVGVRRSWGCVEVANMAYTGEDTGWHYLVAGGWPFYAFHGGGLMMTPNVAIADDRAGAVLELPRWVPTRQNHPPTVPIQPCWRGLGLDLLFWSAVAWMPLAVVERVRGARRRRRRERGECVVCGHPRGQGQVVCAECGAPLEASVRQER